MTQRPEPYRPRKNIKRFHACTNCYVRKIRCSGERPTCRACQKAALDCIYAPKESPKESRTRSGQASTSATRAPAEPSCAAHTKSPLELSPLHGMSLDPVGDLIGQLQPVPEPFAFTFDTSTFHFDAPFPTAPLSTDASYNAVPGGMGAPLSERDAVLEGLLTAEQEEQVLFLYFLHQRTFGSEIHIPTFFAQRNDADPSKRPHRCLILAMILVTSGALPFLRERESEIYSACRTSMDLAIGHERKPFDALRAATLMVTWLTSRGDYIPAFTMVGTAVRLAIFCGLDLIPSSWIDGISQDLPVVRRSVGSCLPFPSSQIELAERIYAFWTVFLVDRFMAIGCDWPPVLDHRNILTPLPRSWGEYLGESAARLPEERLQDVFAAGPAAQSSSQTTLLIKLSLLLHQSSLRNKLVPPHEGSFRFPTMPDDELQTALRKVVHSIPSGVMAVTGERGKRSITAWGAILHLLVGNVEMYLYDTNSYYEDNSRALAAVRRMIVIMRLLGDEEIGDLSLFVVMIWHYMVQLLVMEQKRLNLEDRALEAITVVAEIDFVMECMHRKAGAHPFAGLQATGLDEWRTRAPSEERVAAAIEG